MIILDNEEILNSEQTKTIKNYSFDIIYLPVYSPNLTPIVLF